jgi:hypothetical protein
MPPAVVSRSAERAAVITRALVAAWPMQVLMTAVWLFVPHAGRAHEGWVVAITVAAWPLYLGVLLRRGAILLSRTALTSSPSGASSPCPAWSTRAGACPPASR